MKIDATLEIDFDPKLNRAGQRPLHVNIISADGRDLLLSILGIRYANGAVLDTFVQLGSKVFYHSRTSPELGLAIKNEYFKLKKEGAFEL